MRFRTYFYLACLLFPLGFLAAEGQSFSVAFYDQDVYKEHVHSRVPNYPTAPPGAISTGYLFSYQNALSYPYHPLSIYGGMDFGLWKFGIEESVYTYSSYVSTRLSLLPVLFIHPYIEVSVGGPTYISDMEFGGKEFPSHFIFQSYLAVGVSLTAATVELKILHFGKDWRAKDGFTTPLMGSVGVNF